MKKYILFLFILSFSFSSYIFPQSDSLLIFTKDNCSNCIYTKAQLLNNGINYKEYKLEKSTSVKLMYSKLAEIQYHEKIYLPVIFLNSSIYHPVFYSDSSFIRADLVKVIDSIISKTKKGEIELGISPELLEEEDSIVNKEQNSYCDIKESPTYIICKNFKTKAEAIKFVEMLKKTGYPKSSFLNYKLFFRVYCQVAYSSSEAEEKLLLARKKYKTSYLLNME